MCLGVPGRVVSVREGFALVDFFGVPACASAGLAVMPSSAASPASFVSCFMTSPNR